MSFYTLNLWGGNLLRLGKFLDLEKSYSIIKYDFSSL